MKSSLLWPVAGVLAATAGCVVPITEVADDETPDPAVAYVVVIPRLMMNGQMPKQMTGALTRLDADTALTHTFRIDNGQVQVVKVKPGRYYLSDVDGYPLSFEFKPASSEFVAKAGQLNFPGDWVIREAVGNMELHSLSKSVKYRVNLTAVDADEAAAIAARYPALSKRLPLVHTRVVAR